MAKTCFLSIAFVLFVALPAAAQSTAPVPKSPTALPPPADFPGRSGQERSNLPEDMRIRMEIARADAEYKKTLDEADKLTTLSIEVTRVFHETGKLEGEDLKKVGAIEKLAKHILSQAGGDEVAERSADLQRKPLVEAIEQMSLVADKVQKCIKE